MAAQAVAKSYFANANKHAQNTAGAPAVARRDARTQPRAIPVPSSSSFTMARTKQTARCVRSDARARSRCNALC